MASPRHIAIIMDGNGRWAMKRNLPRIMGHRAGADTADRIVEACVRKGIDVLTLYTFSTENWKRPKAEVDALMSMLEKLLKKNEKKLQENGVRFNVLGRLDALPGPVQATARELMDKTSGNGRMTLNLALNYGGRQEILDAVKAVCSEQAAGNVDAASMREEDFAGYLYTAGLPDPDMLIRTSGEMRISNFLLWQIAYSELYVTDILWPDFSEEELDRALEEYSARERRFGE